MSDERVIALSDLHRIMVEVGGPRPKVGIVEPAWNIDGFEFMRRLEATAFRKEHEIERLTRERDAAREDLINMGKPKVSPLPDGSDEPDHLRDIDDQGDASWFHDPDMGAR
ncbi:hypothetical protein [Microvirga brassicacearum]|uniref:Uncharacterized protein n=1 Tax=Microvirga brassicacearum TaxID=2580413 RepID=A0A5N3PH21_9HYPH|nr:hypothetical protein [Microvirga brassicacearum]KAB0269031.1 hypothetical protein FEZ63_02680 [Microvirga brassicacearum]